MAANQVLYNLARRGIEFDLLPWCAARSIDVMAYSPLDEGALLHHPALESAAARLGVSAAQVALAWVLRDAGVAAIPKAARAEHVRDNRAAARSRRSTTTTLAALDRAFPPPRRKTALAMI